MGICLTKPHYTIVEEILYFLNVGQLNVLLTTIVTFFYYGRNSRNTMAFIQISLFSSTKEKANKDEIGMKSGKSEEAVLLQGVNGDKKSPTE